MQRHTMFCCCCYCCFWSIVANELNTFALLQNVNYSWIRYFPEEGIRKSVVPSGTTVIRPNQFDNAYILELVLYIWMHFQWAYALSYTFGPCLCALKCMIIMHCEYERILAFHLGSLLRNSLRFVWQNRMGLVSHTICTTLYVHRASCIWVHYTHEI